MKVEHKKYLLLVLFVLFLSTLGLANEEVVKEGLVTGTLSKASAWLAGTSSAMLLSGFLMLSGWLLIPQILKWLAWIPKFWDKKQKKLTEKLPEFKEFFQIVDHFIDIKVAALTDLAEEYKKASIDGKISPEEQVKLASLVHKSVVNNLPKHLQMFLESFGDGLWGYVRDRIRASVNVSKKNSQSLIK